MTRQPALGSTAAKRQVSRCLGSQLRVHVAGQRIDIDEYRHGLFEKQGIAGGHKGERGGQDQVAGANAGRAHAQMQPGGAGIDADGMAERRCKL